MEKVYLIGNERMPRVKQKLRVFEVEDEGVISIQSVNYINNILAEIKVSKDAAEDLRTALDEILNDTPQPQGAPDKENNTSISRCKVCKHYHVLDVCGVPCCWCRISNNYLYWRCAFEVGEVVYSSEFPKGTGRIISLNENYMSAFVKFENGNIYKLPVTSLIKAEGD